MANKNCRLKISEQRGLAEKNEPELYGYVSHTSHLWKQLIRPRKRVKLERRGEHKIYQKSLLRILILHCTPTNWEEKRRPESFNHKHSAITNHFYFSSDQDLSVKNPIEKQKQSIIPGSVFNLNNLILKQHY